MSVTLWSQGSLRGLHAPVPRGTRGETGHQPSVGAVELTVTKATPRAALSRHVQMKPERLFTPHKIKSLKAQASFLIYNEGVSVGRFMDIALFQEVSMWGSCAPSQWRTQTGAEVLWPSGPSQVAEWVGESLPEPGSLRREFQGVPGVEKTDDLALL